MRELELALLHSSRSTKRLGPACPRLEEQQPCTPQGILQAAQRGCSLLGRPSSPSRSPPFPGRAPSGLQLNCTIARLQNFVTS